MPVYFRPMHEAPLTGRTIERRVAKSLAAEIHRGLGTSHFRSVEFVDLIVWNILVAFVVNLAASTAYDWIRERIRRGERLREAEMDRAMAVLDEPLPAVTAEEAEAAAQVAVLLYDYEITPSGSKAICRLLIAEVLVASRRPSQN